MRSRIAALLLLGSTLSGTAASLTTETFEVSAAGWGSMSTNLTLSVAHTNSGGNPGGALSLVLPQASFIPVSDALAATGGTAAAAFLGDYTAISAELLSFDIRAETIVPETNSMTVRLHSGTNMFRRIYDNLILATGVWYGIRLPLHDPQLGGWTNEIGPPNFEALKTNITRIEFVFRQSQLSAQRFRIDSIALEPLPRAHSIISGSNSVTITWTPLRAGRAYRMEAAENDASSWSWSNSTSFVATSSTHSLTVVAAPSGSNYRLMW